MSEQPYAAPMSIRPMLEGVKCFECLDTNLQIGLYGVQACDKCSGARLSRSNAATMLARVIFNRLERKQTVEPMLVQLARILTRFSSENPMPGAMLEVHLRLDYRTAKSMIETLRRDYLLPIGSRKGQPNGYWIMTTATEFIEWDRQFRSSAISVFATSYRLMRANFPALAGQTSLDFTEAVKQQIDEEIQ